MSPKYLVVLALVLGSTRLTAQDRPLFASPGAGGSTASSAMDPTAPEAKPLHRRLLSPDPQWLLDGARTARAAANATVHSRSVWKASLAALAVASAVDVHSSWGKPEANPLLAGPGGRFGARSVAIKAVITGAALGLQWAVTRRNPRALPYATAGNLALTAVYAGVAVHNYRNSASAR